MKKKLTEVLINVFSRKSEEFVQIAASKNLFRIQLLTLGLNWEVITNDFQEWGF